MEEMSGRWLSSGRQLTIREYNEYLKQNRTEKSNRRFECCRKSFMWLKCKLGLQENFDLEGMLREMDINGSAQFYNPLRIIQKPEGGVRIIISPKLDLMLVQERVHRLLKRTFPRPPHAFGYRGGSCIELVRRHQDYKSTFKFDIRDAFFQVGYARVYSAIRGRQLYRFTDEKGFEWLSKFSPGFSKSVTHWIARICTYSPRPDQVAKLVPHRARSFLAQGAPTSPICFDLACAPLDKKLQKIALRVSGIVSRYADNYYFSVSTPEISQKLEAMIVCSTQRRYGFPIHKLRNVSEGELCRILGYNIDNNEVSNTRDFLRKLRGALYVLQTRIDRGLDWQDAYFRVNGLMGWAVNLPQKLQEVYEYCMNKISQT